MLRAQREWKRYGKGPWNHQTNAPALQELWRQGIRNMGTHESIMTMAMRGDGDEPMSEENNIILHEKIVADQRRILAEETHKPADQTPQLWALYKEVQDYYDRSMRVPDDMTLLLCDDNWGNLCKLPKLGDKPRTGGYGIYYHFDYVGGPRSYRWLNTNSLPRVWEQMHLAHENGVKQIWIVNVGDLKPVELPTSFILDCAWNPDALPADGVAAYTQRWAAQKFGPKYAVDIADILVKYTKYNSRRKPELLDAKTYSLATGEWATVVADYNQLPTRAEAISRKLPPTARNAFFEPMLHPVLACANLNEQYYTVALNREAAKTNQPNTNALVEKARALFAKDAEIKVRYHAVAAGKWNYMMIQLHIGYTSWHDEPKDIMPEVMTLAASAVPTPAPTPAAPKNGAYVSLEAEHYTQVINAGPITWQRLPDLGRTLGAVTTFPTTAAPTVAPGGSSPHLEYRIVLTQPGPVTVSAYLAPTLDFINTTGLRYAVSLDEEAPQIINLHTGMKPGESNLVWERAVANDIILKTSQHNMAAAGAYVPRFWRVDPGVVLEKLVVSQGPVPASYLGPPATAAGLGKAVLGTLGSR